MKYFATLPAVVLAACLPVYAQQAISVVQQQYIQTRAINFVNTFTTQLELLGRTRSAEEREEYKQPIYLRFGKDKEKTRVYNDLVPPRLRRPGLEMETSLQLAAYLSKIAELYPDGLRLTYANPRVSDVFYSRADNWYFVKVTADRNVDGVYSFKAQLTPYAAQDQVDFFVNAYLVNGEMKMGGIYGVSPHDGNTAGYVKVGVERRDSDIGVPLSVGKALAVNKQTIRKQYRRGGSEYAFGWEGGLSDDIIQVELIPLDTAATFWKRAARRKNLVPIGLNANGASFTLSNKTVPGKYVIRVKNISTARFVQSAPFRVNRAIPLGARAAAGVAVGGYLVIARIAGLPPFRPKPIGEPPVTDDM